MKTCKCTDIVEKSQDSSNFQIPLTPALSSSQMSPVNDTNNGRLNVGRINYLASDAAPYVIHIQKEQSSPDENCSIHPIGFGHFLKNHSFKNIIDGSLKRIGRNRVSISFSTYEVANSFVNNKDLSLNKYRAFIPSVNVTRMGVVRGVPISYTDEEILSNITVPMGCGNILKVRRLKKKTIVNGNAEFIGIETVVLTFDGQILPKRVFMCYNSLPVDLYIYPTIQCFNCCRYGHIKSQCRSTPRCFKCGGSHTGHGCELEEDSLYCCLCSGSHIATSKKCPEFSRQKSVKESMAKNCLSYAEAIKLYPPVSKLYSDVLSSTVQPNKSQIIYENMSNPNRTSYKKTIFIKPKGPQKPNSKGYDQRAHSELVKDYSIPLPTIGSINNRQNSLSDLPLKDLILTLISSLVHSNIISLPTNIASFIESINDNKNTVDGSSQHNSVELP